MSGLVALALRLLLTLVLYGFLGWALLAFWREITREADKVVKRRAPGISLKIRVGEDLATVRHFIQSEITLGRDRMCDIPVADETVSARHARLTYHHNQWWLEDLNSTNGTRLNQALITSPTVLTSEDEIDVGPTHVTVELATDESISATRRLTE